MKLTDKQEKFCNEYLIDLNATQAAIRAGYSENSAQIIGFENLTKPIIAERITFLKSKRSERTEIKQDDVLKELAGIGFSNISDVLDVGDMGVTLKEGKELKDLPRNVTALISEIKETKEGLSIKLHDKLGAIEKMMKHLGMYDEHNRQKKDEVNIGKARIEFVKKT